MMAHCVNPRQVLLVSEPFGDEFHGLGMPKPADNLFTRIIGDPAQPDRPMRERRCTEMFRAVLVNCPILCDIVLKWLALKADCPEGLIDDLDWRMETERAIGSKRDDLRIEGWLGGDEDERLEVLWTVEVKVQAYFHESTDQTRELIESDDDVMAVELPKVNQLINYDAWLVQQDVSHKAGFVLATLNHENALPAGLTCSWHCITWTALGKVIADALDADALPDSEKEFARHMCGFVQQHLWREEEMTEKRLNFDHAAILRAVWTMGKECEALVNDFVSPLVEIVKQSELDIGEVRHTKNIFMGSQRSVVWGMLGATQITNVNLFAGFDSGGVWVWIESAPAHPKKNEIQKMVQGLLPDLHARNPNWATTLDNPSHWPDLGIGMPLIDLLAVENQAQAVTQFVQNALTDLKTVEIDRLIRDICGDGAA